MNPTPLEYSCWTTHWSAIRWHVFAVFILIVMVVGVFTVYLASLRKPHKKCELNFIQSIKRVEVYDSRPRQIATGTFNKDKHLDLVVANSGTDSIGIFLGYGNATFAAQITQSTGLGSRPYSVAIGDFNNDTQLYSDNLLDLVVANWGTNNVLVFLGKDNGTFYELKSYSLGYGARPQSVAFEDMNNDLLFDIIVVNDGPNYIEILLQTC